MYEIHYDSVLVDAPSWFYSTRSIDCKSKNEGVVSLVQTVVRNAPNFETDLHHFVLLDSHVDGDERFIDVLDPGCMIGHKQIFLPDIAELLPKLQLLSCCACHENPLHVCSSIFGHCGISDVVEELITNTRRESVHYYVCRLLPDQKAPVLYLVLHHLLLQHNSSTHVQAGTGASCMTKMRSCSYRASPSEVSFPSLDLFLFLFPFLPGVRSWFVLVPCWQ